MKKIFLIVVAIFIACGCMIAAGAAEIDESLGESRQESLLETEMAITEAEPTTDDETNYASEGSEESEGVGEAFGPETTAGESPTPGLYGTVSRWAEENPTVFAAGVLAVAVIAFGISQLIAFTVIKRRVVASSDNAVSIYEDAVEKIKAAYEDAGKLEEDVRRRAEGALGDALAALQAMRDQTSDQLRVIKSDREAVLLLAEVVGRLLEESALPARVRDEIHALLLRANGQLEGLQEGGDGHEPSD